MQLTFELPDKLAQQFLEQVPSQKRNSFLEELFVKKFGNKAQTDDDLPFAVLTNTEHEVNNDFINQLREEEGI